VGRVVPPCKDDVGVLPEDVPGELGQLRRVPEPEAHDEIAVLHEPQPGELRQHEGAGVFARTCLLGENRETANLPSWYLSPGWRGDQKDR
jgi:hypothetical protein